MFGQQHCVCVRASIVQVQIRCRMLELHECAGLPTRAERRAADMLRLVRHPMCRSLIMTISTQYSAPWVQHEACRAGLVECGQEPRCDSIVQYSAWPGTRSVYLHVRAPAAVLCHAEGELHGRFRGLLALAVGHGCALLGTCAAHTQRSDRWCALHRGPDRAHPRTLTGRTRRPCVHISLPHPVTSNSEKASDQQRAKSSTGCAAAEKESR